MIFKIFKLLKKLSVLTLVLILCVENYAATVSDNDGSAFITKAEFDSLKNNFQSKLDKYNTSIDVKIDSAIASYLSGVKIESEQTISTVLRNWDNVTIRNYELKNQYGYPKVDFLYSWYGSGHNASSWNLYPSSYGLAASGNGTGQYSKLKYVLLKEGKESDYRDITKNKFYWGGYINDYDEKISMSKLGYSNNNDVASAFSEIALAVYDIVKLNAVGNNYYTNADLGNFWNSIWKPTIKWTGKAQAGTPSGKDIDPEFAGGFFNWSSTFHTDEVSNKYELTWQSIDENIINPNFNNCFYTFSDNNKSSKNVYDSITLGKAGTWLKANNCGTGRIIPDSAAGTRTSTGTTADDRGSSYEWIFLESHYNPTDLNASIYDWARGATSGGQYAIPTLGGLGPISSADIYLQKDDLSYTFKNKDYKKDITTMNNGFPLVYATKDSKLKWECQFSDIQGSSDVTTNGEVKVILSYGEFDDGSSSPGGYVQKDGKKGNTEYAFTTTGKKVKITWTMQEDGWIYAKWFPAALTSASAATATNWSVTLDNANSNKIVYVDET